MYKKLILLSLLAVMLFGMVAVVGAITWGQPDGNGHPHVGTLLYRRVNGLYYSCTGTLLSPTVMLTAGHCVEDSGVENLQTWVNFDPEITFEGRSNYPSLIAYLDAEWIKTKDVIPHPQYNDYMEFPNTYDVGIVILAKPVYTSTYGKLPPLGFLDTLVKGEGKEAKRFKAVGYGSQGILPPVDVDEYARYVGNTYLMELNSARTGDRQSATFTNNPGQDGGTCFGDSGGPLFHQDSNVIGAVVSFGYTPCIGVDYQYRIDTPDAQNFIKKYLK
jgi:hypothetical protein